MTTLHGRKLNLLNWDICAAWVRIFKSCISHYSASSLWDFLDFWGYVTCLQDGLEEKARFAWHLCFSLYLDEFAQNYQFNSRWPGPSISEQSSTVSVSYPWFWFQHWKCRWLTFFIQDHKGHEGTVDVSSADFHLMSVGLDTYPNLHAGIKDKSIFSCSSIQSSTSKVVTSSNRPI